ncbi:MAG: S41 family peptidase [Bacteroidota bacterium]|nr:S41 family peptidase [Bacteroidota bacterium]
MKNNTRAIFTPIILASFLAAGIYIGARLLPDNQSGTHNTTTSTSKIEALFQLIKYNYVDAVSTDSIEELAFPLLLKELDPHSVYISPEDMVRVDEQMTGNFEGIGIQFNMHDDTLLVVNTISGGPSEKVGVLAGDRIVTIDDSLFVGKEITTDDIMHNLKGEKGTEVKIGVKRMGIDSLIYFTIERDKIPLYSVDVSYMINDNIGYIKINRFSGTTYDEFMKATKKLLAQGMTKIVLDLRQNGGGLLGNAAKIADEFISDGKMIVYLQGNSRKRSEYLATAKGICEDLEVAVLVDTWSASASEIVSGAIQDNDRGVIIGRRTFGKGLVQEPFEFQNGGVIRLTTARYYTPTGRSIQKPYTNGSEDYMHDIADRMDKGELTGKDSISFPDSLKFTTPKGKTVYGGGGIMPDIFVPVDTSDYSDYYGEIFNTGLVYQFALNYSDKHRTQLNRFTDAHQINKFLTEKNVTQEFINFTQKKGITFDPKGFKISEKRIKVQLHALIARNIMQSEGYYPLIQETDQDLLRAVQELE